ncbi:MAG: Nif3-like dinuclear metal center hexameric protein [Kofleriaceae bacterium]|nr:Nif3-like dinuclear metal center hexameric protein [Kofleriaceae bacterium]
MTVRLHEVVSFLDSTLEIEGFRDSGLNGLQVQGSAEVDRIVTAVSASAEVFERAIELDADLVVVHHGLIWGKGIERVTGTMARRLNLLLSHSMSLASYHLPLDVHPRLGNNVGLADAIALQANRSTFGRAPGQETGPEIGLLGAWGSSLSLQDAVLRIGAGVCNGQTPRFVFPFGPQQVRTVGLCTGAASFLLEAAAQAGCDIFVTGELSENSVAIAKELQITLVAVGHYATEVFGVLRLVDELRMKFADLQIDFVDVPTPI